MTAQTAATDSIPILFGLKLYELLTLVGIVIGPIVAVAITLVVERIRFVRERRLIVFRTLLSTFKLMGDSNFSAAMNMLLVEFNRHKGVMAARQAYLNLANQRVAPEYQSEHNEQMGAKQIAVVYQVAKALGFSITEGELKTESYISQGMIDRDNILLDSQRAMRDIASTMQKQQALLEEIIKAQGSNQER